MHKLCQMWQLLPVILTTQMAEAGGLGRQYQPLLQDETGAHQIGFIVFVFPVCERYAVYPVSPEP